MSPFVSCLCSLLPPRIAFSARLPFQYQETVRNLLCSGWRLSRDLRMRSKETLALTHMIPNEPHIEIYEVVVR